MQADTEFSFLWEWESAPGVRSPELAATWARLEIWVGGDCVTRVEDQDRNARRSIYVPLYPLAEWIAYNWWTLRADARPTLHLTNRRARFEGARRLQRHRLRSAGDGFCWPDLVLIPEGASTRLAWRPDRDASVDRPIRFISQGESFVAGSRVAHELSTLVEGVVTRLAEQGIVQSTLSTEWEAVKQTEPEEEEFCLAAARLGLDPYAEADEFQDEILRVSEHLRGSIFEDFLNAVSPRRIGSGLQWIADAQGIIEGHQGRPNDVIGRLRREVGSTPVARSPERPWEAGWRQANLIRRILGISAAEVIEPDQFVESAVRGSGDRGLQAMGGAAVADAAPVVVLGRQQSDETNRFTLARALWRVLNESNVLFLVTAAHTDRQKKERAFAAELLAPAQGVAEYLGDDLDLVSAEDLEEVAQHFRVSTMVVEHQVQNQLSGSPFQWVGLV
jgi:hypothetical protein